MDYKQLFVDIFSFKISSFYIRISKLRAIVKRHLILPLHKNFNKGKDIKNIPIIINNRNRLTYLIQLIVWLENAGFKNIYIIDNDSTYPPLLDYYSKTKHTIFYLKKNVGHLSLWETGLIKKFEKDYYIYTDPDVLPIEECPKNVISFFMQQLNKYKNIEKIGFGLKIDDLPDSYVDKKKVLEWESKYWMKEIEKDIFDAEIDTTFALYRPYTNGFVWVQKAYRTGGVYLAKHLPWYENSKNESEETLFYKKEIKKGSSHWIKEST